MKAKDTLLLNNIITQNHILARRAWFWRVASHFTSIGLNLTKDFGIVTLPKLNIIYKIEFQFKEINQIVFFDQIVLTDINFLGPRVSKIDLEGQGHILFLVADYLCWLKSQKSKYNHT